MHGHGAAVQGTAVHGEVLPVPNGVQAIALPATTVQTTAIGGPLEPPGTARQVGQVGHILIEEVQFQKSFAAGATAIWIGSRLCGLKTPTSITF